MSYFLTLIHAREIYDERLYFGVGRRASTAGTKEKWTIVEGHGDGYHVNRLSPEENVPIHEGVDNSVVAVSSWRSDILPAVVSFSTNIAGKGVTINWNRSIESRYDGQDAVHRYREL